MIESAALLAVVLPAVAAVLGLTMGGRSRPWAVEWARLGAAGALLAALAELVGVLHDGPVDSIGFLGRADIGPLSLGLDLRADRADELKRRYGLVADAADLDSSAVATVSGGIAKIIRMAVQRLVQQNSDMRISVMFGQRFL